MQRTIAQPRPADDLTPGREDLVPSVNEPGLWDLVLLLYRSRRFILALTLTGGIIGTAGALLTTPRYTAMAVIMPPQQPHSAASALLGQLGPLANLAGRDIGMRNPADVYLGILRSRTIADNLIRQFSLDTLYKTRTMTDARSALEDHTRILAGQDSLIRIMVDDSDPNRAASLANAYVKELFGQNNKLALTESAQRRVFFERQLREGKERLSASEEALRQTQQQTGLLQVTGQVDALVRAAAQLRAEVGTREVAIERLKEGATPQNPELARLNAEMRALSSQIRKLESGAATRPSGSPIIPTAGVPQAGLLYVRALREVKYHEALFEVYAKQFEAAKIDEAKEAPALQIVDAAIPPDKKSWPPRALVVVSAAFLSALISGLIVVLRSRINDLRSTET